MSEIKIHDATTEDIQCIGKGINRHNDSQAPFSQVPEFVSFNKCIKDGDKVVAGILSEMYLWNILTVDILWVDEEYRNKGYATILLKYVEKQGKEMGCTLSHLDTFDFQARGLYEKLGYRVFGILEDCPEGHERYYMSKKL